MKSSSSSTSSMDGPMSKSSSQPSSTTATTMTKPTSTSTMGSQRMGVMISVIIGLSLLMFVWMSELMEQQSKQPIDLKIRGVEYKPIQNPKTILTEDAMDLLDDIQNNNNNNNKDDVLEVETSETNVQIPVSNPEKSEEEKEKEQTETVEENQTKVQTEEEVQVQTNGVEGKMDEEEEGEGKSEVQEEVQTVSETVEEKGEEVQIETEAVEENEKEKEEVQEEATEENQTEIQQEEPKNGVAEVEVEVEVEEEPIEEVEEEEKSQVQEDTSSSTTTTDSSSSNQCSNVCNTKREQRMGQFQNKNILNRDHLISLVQDAKVKLHDKLKVDYGDEYFETIFYNQNNGRAKGMHSISQDEEINENQNESDNDLSTERLLRRLQIKVLRMQQKVIQKESNVNGCNCIENDTPINQRGLQHQQQQRHLSETNIDDDDDEMSWMEPVVWVTGGHSSSAGHGNLYNESYTAYMERDLIDVFGSIGLEFEGRNYAMGGTSAGYEISMCSEEIFGGDADFMSWDYGMTDGRVAFKFFYYFYRAGIVQSTSAPSLPLAFGLKMNNIHRKKYLKLLEGLGMGSFVMEDDTIREAIPDTFGRSTDEIFKMPPYIRSLKCSGQFEAGDPFCGEQKWSKDMCNNRQQQTSWHPGYKVHAFTGHAMALFLVEALEDALEKLSQNPNQNVESLLQELEEKEIQEKQQFKTTQLPDSIPNDFYSVGKKETKDPSLEAQVGTLLSGKSVCHTGRLPAQTRYKGYLLDNGKVGGIAPFGKEEYEVGILEDVAKQTKADGKMRLTYVTFRERFECPIPVKPDYRDMFYAHQKDGVQTLTFPNKAERQAYHYDTTQKKGVVVIHLALCAWGKCPKGDQREQQFKTGNFTMTINDEPVTRMITLQDGLVLKNKNGMFFESNSNGEYEFKVSIKEPNGFLRLSTLVVYHDGFSSLEAIPDVEEENVEDLEKKTTNNLQTKDDGGKVQMEEKSEEKSELQNEDKSEVQKEEKSGEKQEEVSNQCKSICSSKQQERKKHFQNKDILNLNDLVSLVKGAKKKLHDKLKKDYGGQYFESIFYTIGKNAKMKGAHSISKDEEVTANEDNDGRDLSRERLKRKLQRKILGVQQRIISKESDIDGCDCINSDASTTNRRQLRGLSKPYNVDDEPWKVPVLWVTGGHSSSAGHGNLYNESYTAYMERDLINVFGSIGLEFEGRNYAMGGTSSGLEVAMCSEEIFGNDADFVSWDYGMTDGRDYAKFFYYFYRAGLLHAAASLPLAFGIHMSNVVRKNHLKTFEGMGMGSFVIEEDSVREAVPDTFGRSTADIAKMPPYIRNFKCSGQLEVGDPFCGDEKWSTYMCNNREQQTGWHPGYKSHALTGHVMSLFLVEALEEAVEELANNGVQSPTSRLKEIQREERNERTQFDKAALPDGLEKDIYATGKAGKTHDDMISKEIATFIKGRSLCHTGRLPAQTRYKGYLMNDGKVGGIAPLGEEKYSVGTLNNEAMKTDANGEIRLVYSMHRERYECATPVKPDYRDLFIAYQKDGEQSLVFPNKAERKAFHYDANKMKGIVVVFFALCPWGKCPPGDQRADELVTGKWRMTINGERVTKAVPIKEGHILMNKDGMYFKSNSNGEYEVKVSVIEVDGFVRFSSFIAF